MVRFHIPPLPAFPLARAWLATRLAFTFLTVIPIPTRDGLATGHDLAESRYAYPLAGGLIGLILVALSMALDRRGGGPGPSAVLLLIAWVAITGGLHLDGLADTADGLFLGGDSERRLAVMRDPRVGSFGVIAIVLVLLGKYSALVELAGQGRASALLAAATIGRALILVSAGSARYARPEGTGRILVEATTPRDALGAGILVLIVGASLAGTAGLIAAVFTVALAQGITQLATRKLGGITGDILGALVELGELTFLILLALT